MHLAHDIGERRRLEGRFVTAAGFVERGQDIGLGVRQEKQGNRRILRDGVLFQLVNHVAVGAGHGALSLNA